MRRWLPRSLFSRLVLVLLAGLVLAQAAGLAIYWRDRDEFMHRALGLRSVQRVADIIRVLDEMPAADRGRIVGILNSPQLRISFDVPPLDAQNDTAQSHADSERFVSALRRTLGAEREFVVRVAKAPFIKGPPAGYGPGMMRGGGPGVGMYPGMGPGALAVNAVSFVVQAQLRDGTLITLDSRQPRDAAAAPYRLMASLAVLLLAVIAIALIAVRWVTRPLKTLAEAAEQLGENIDRPPLDEGGPAEVSRAARAFNTMQQRLSKLIGERARVFAAMSHDLKTPITRLRLRAELLDDEKLRAKFERDLGEMEQMVSGALDLVRGLERQEPPQTLDLTALLESVCADARLTGGAVELHASTPVSYVGRPQALRRCFANLVENAVKYGGGATITVTDMRHAVEVRVQDRGRGIPEAELERVFEPFYRVEQSRSRDTGGTGLGLSIALNIAHAHGGDLALRNLPGGGLEALLTLPR